MNLYATPTEIKAGMPDGMRSTTTSYDGLLYRLAGIVSRHFDKYCRRVFYPELATRHFNGNGEEELWIPDLISFSSLSYSLDNGTTFTSFTQSGNFHLTVAGDYNDPRSYTLLVLDPNGTRATWPIGVKNIKLTSGVWGCTDDREACWEDSQDTVEDDPLTAAATSITTNDADGADQWGITPRFQAGQLLRIESEYVEVTGVNTSTQVLTVVRGRNGSTAAQHAQDTTIEIWRPVLPVKQAAVIQAVRQMERGLQGFGDARATAEIGELLFIRDIDPEAKSMLSAYRKHAI